MGREQGNAEGNGSCRDPLSDETPAPYSSNLLGDAAAISTEVWRESRAPDASAHTTLRHATHVSAVGLDAMDAVAARLASCEVVKVKTAK